MNVEILKDGIYIVVLDEARIYRRKLSPREAWRLSKELERALFQWKELTGINPLQED